MLVSAAAMAWQQKQHKVLGTPFTQTKAGNSMECLLTFLQVCRPVILVLEVERVLPHIDSEAAVRARDRAGEGKKPFVLGLRRPCAPLPSPLRTSAPCIHLSAPCTVIHVVQDRRQAALKPNTGR